MTKCSWYVLKPLHMLIAKLNFKNLHQAARISEAGQGPRKVWGKMQE